MQVAWGAPADSGAGVGNGHPLLGYEVSLILLGESGGNIEVRSEAVGTGNVEFVDLVKGARYQVRVRAQNDALDQSGFGAAAVAAGVCADGVTRAGVCDAEGLVAVSVPDAPTTLEASVAGSGVVGVSYGVPMDTGDGTSAFPVLEYSLEWEGRAVGESEVSAGGTVELGATVFAWETPLLPAGMGVSVDMRARNGAGWSAETPLVEIEVVVSPSAPTFFETARAFLEITASWESPAETGKVQLVEKQPAF
ncbi:hypothetical protein T484DRAFT_1855605 [Baffinella frigidus]|nr:hypothetical protein T484DRAFT_1855605 [Cryptophyta sp. CCMP2293]